MVLSKTPPVLLMLAMASLLGHAAEDSPASHLESAMTAAHQAIDHADGLDATEAKLLASAYFTSAISGCGGIGEVKDVDGSWIADSRIGLGAQKGPEVIIARNGAFVRAEGYGSVTFANGKAVVHEADQPRGSDRVEPSAPPPVSPIETAMSAALHGIDRSDGIDASEAKALASAYFGSAISGCGGIGEVRQADGVWIVDSRIGRGAQDGPDVTVARDGTFIRAAGYPSVTIAGDTVSVHSVDVPKP